MLRPMLPQGLRHVECRPAASMLNAPTSARARRHLAHPCPSRGHAHEQLAPPAALFTPVASSSNSSDPAPSPSPTQPQHGAAAASASSIKRHPPSHQQHSRPSTPAPGPDRSAPLSPAELHDETLYEEIRACDAWQDVLDVVTDEGANMSTKRVVQALGRFGTLLKAARLAPQARTEATSRPEFQQLLQLLYPKLPSLKSSQACSVAVNLALLNVRPEPPHLQQLLEVLQHHAIEFDARDVASIMHALPSLGVGPGAPARATMDALSVQACKILHVQLKPLRPKAQQQPAEQSDPPTPEPTPAPVEEAAAAAAPQRRRREADAFTPQGVCLVLGAAAALDYRNTKLITDATDAVLAHSSSYTPQGMSNVLRATATLEHYFPPLLRCALDYFSQHRAAFKPKETAGLMWALCRLRHHPQQHAQALAQALLGQPEGALRGADLAALLQLLATFCVFPGKQVMAQVCRRLQALVPQCSAEELCGSLRSLGLLGETKRPVFAQIAALLPAHFERGELDEGLLRQVFQALLCATLADSPPAPASPPSPSDPSPSPPTPSPSAVPSFPPLMMDTMKRLWLSTIQGGAYRANRTVSPTKAVSDLVTQLQVRHDSARATKDGLVLIDIALRPSQERYVALQVLRGFDHSRNTDQLLGPAQLERQILEKNGWEVKYLLYQDLLQVAPDAQLFFIAEYLRNIGCRMQREVAAPGGKAVDSAAGAAARAPKAQVSGAAREANILLRDPKSSGPRTRKAA